MKRILKSSRGFTLMELVITFALTALFVVLTTMILSASTAMYARVSEREASQTLAAQLLNKVTGEISAAQDNNVTIAETGADVDEELQIATGCGIDFYDRNGSKMYITKDAAGYLVIHYRPNVTLELEASDWRFDKAVYKGYTIKSLSFTKLGTQNVIKVDLTIVKGDYEYSATAYATCHNIANADKISNGMVLLSEP